MEVKEDDVVMCTVRRIEGTSVFLDVEGDGTGSMTMSEVAAGRIRNLRDYITINKKIVCKVLKIVNGHPQLSLRRVTGKEREEIVERHKKERALSVLLKNVVKNFESVLESIRKDYDLCDYYDEIRENPSSLDKYLEKEESLKIGKILSEKKDRDKISKKEIVIKSYSEEGLDEIKEALNVEGVDIKYLGSSVFSISSTGKDFREANLKVDSAIEEIERRARDKKLFFEIKKAK
jgi:translation initiation factor 2 alpha subunit (eIF-2alpha)